jgi:hypothetical protein
MGLIYENSVFISVVSTHDVNLPHLLEVNPSFSPQIDSQHTSCFGVTMTEVKKNKRILHMH